ncbi:hypothetical protein BDZ90DRAFT_219466 [Jaminaea rosea]|uniref:tRNA (guanine(10)-N(2))-methyltransferase n=1 Tax=Jaminaea rosea TaxID=1569628 RepID=A0A316URU8_9BASI|nr:hypothetical protein BDZ90DRAFT_219466 [Jaminaea rosea]PWN28007.1 hypothetical protein BDZ90DRAFT_219466 [Jaminaea rosea]
MSQGSDPSTSAMRLYAIVYPLSHPTFRIPVLESVAKQHDIPITFFPLPPDSSRAFSIVALPSDAAASTLLHRCTAIRNIIHLWSVGTTREGTISALQHSSSQRSYSHLQPPSLSWKADVASLGLRLTADEKRSIIDSCRFLDFEGPINLSKPDFEWCWYEERWGIEGAHMTDRVHASQAQALRLVVVGRKITAEPPLASGSKSQPPTLARDWIDRLDLKKRSYIGNTSMESEMSLAMAQMAMSAPGKIIYDPFVGTGSLVVAAAALGAYVMGSDIDGRMIRGKGKEVKEDPGCWKETGVLRAARQYGLEGRFLDCLTCDITQHPWRLLHPSAASSSGAGPSRPAFLDAIIADPPYGVRAGAKRLGHRDVARQRDTPYWLEEKGGYSHEQEDYVPPTRPYALNDLLDDLLSFASRMLKEGGRLVFWMPGRRRAKAKASTAPVPTGPEWDLIAVSVQDFGKWARRLVTLQLKPRGAAEAVDDGQAKAATAGDGDASSAQRRSEGQSQFDATTGRYKGNVDQKDFRNQYFGPRG